MAQTKVKLISDGVIVQGNLHSSHGITTAHIGEGSNLYYTDARVGSYLSTNSFATESYVGTQISNLVASSPAALDTLNELAVALGNDANFSTTITNLIATKMPLAGGTFTGNVSLIASSAVNLRVTDGTQNVYVGSSGSTRFGLGAGASIIQSTGASFGVGTQDGNSLILGTNNTAALTINTSQNANFTGTGTFTDAVTVNGSYPGLILNSTSHTKFAITNRYSTNYVTFDMTPQGGSTLEALTLKNNGFLGINRNSPNGLLHQQSAAGSNSEYYIQTGDTTTNSTIYFGDSDSSIHGGIDYDHNDDSMSFKVNNSTRMVIDSSGNVGIAATPGTYLSSIRALRIGQGASFSAFTNSLNTYVSSNVRVDATGTNKAIVTGESAQYRQSDGLHIWYNAASVSAGATSTLTERMRIDSSGIVNIGTATGTQPSYFNSYLNVQNNASTSNHASITITSGSSGYAGLHFGDSDNGRIGQVAYNNSNNSLLFTANNSTRMTIDSSGNVGIGVTPFAHTLGTSASLDLKGNGGIWGYAGATYVNSNAYYDSGWKYKTTAPAAVLQVGGSSQELTFRQAVSGTAGNAITYTQPFTIDTSGKVGIGTTSPTSQLTIKNTSGDNRGILVDNTVAASYAEVSVKSDTREFRMGTGGSGTNNSRAQDMFYIYDATTGGTAGHRFEIRSDGQLGSTVYKSIGGSADTLYTTLNNEIAGHNGSGMKYLGQLNIRDGSRYLDVALNTTSNNIMFYIYVIEVCIFLVKVDILTQVA